jgi:hypothetical protein
MLFLKLASAAVAATLVAGPGLAQTAQERAPRPPAAVTGTQSEPHPAIKSAGETWDQTKRMTRKQWNAAKRKWAQEKVQWRDCNAQAKREKLSGPKSWSYIASCMTKS